MFITHYVWGTMKPGGNRRLFVKLQPSGAVKTKDKKMLKDKSAVFFSPFCLSGVDVYIYLYLRSPGSISPLSPLSHTARIDQYLIFSPRQWEVEVCDCCRSAPLPFHYVLCSFSLLSFPSSSLALLGLIDCCIRSRTPRLSRWSFALALALSLLSLSNVMSRR